MVVVVSLARRGDGFGWGVSLPPPPPGRRAPATGRHYHTSKSLVGIMEGEACPWSEHDADACSSLESYARAWRLVYSCITPAAGGSRTTARTARTCAARWPPSLCLRRAETKLTLASLLSSVCGAAFGQVVAPRGSAEKIRSPAQLATRPTAAGCSLSSSCEPPFYLEGFRFLRPQKKRL